ncbi:TlpA family protein disulfide reductase [Blastopirellula sp. JC732]|uniref:TlpA family protein disulfide reductase n=1 Tax=Blastopirellula sediminis TaxID=2894196 RepID=A0A9X1SEQ7_9BACT|nr:TlpA disulfide reductase family protein [Blastopirellula sediminis]MCC9609088.1 TlpA family protein disulfide reductase [Blastopirellula sediminis]MCC9628135.1 TlpA family protein disulfide reductase [Blastopirellula sediminis]
MSLLTHNLRASLLAVAAIATPVCILSPAAFAADAAPAAVEAEAVVDFDPATSDDVAALSAHIDTLRRELGGLKGTAEERKAGFVTLMGEMTVTCQRIIDLNATGTTLAKANTFKIVSLGAISGATGSDEDKAAFDAAIDEGLASEISDVVQISIYQLLDGHIRGRMTGKELDVDQMLADAQKKIAMDKPGVPGLIAAKIIAPYFIGVNRPEGVEMLANAIELNADSDNPAIQSALKKVEGLHRRSTIIGKPLELSGTMLDGSELDWSAYRGKVVLVDFFATWCGPCRAEMPHVLEMYEKYKGQGFEVLGISLDDSKENAESYIAEMKLPWKTMLPVEESERGWNHPLVTYLGIDGIPQAILVDQEGNVINLNARGDKLTSELKRLLDPAPEAPAAAADKT